MDQGPEDTGRSEKTARTAPASADAAPPTPRSVRNVERARCAVTRAAGRTRPDNARRRATNEGSLPAPEDAASQDAASEDATPQAPASQDAGASDKADRLWSRETLRRVTAPGKDSCPERPGPCTRSGRLVGGGAARDRGTRTELPVLSSKTLLASAMQGYPSGLRAQLLWKQGCSGNRAALETGPAGKRFPQRDTRLDLRQRRHQQGAQGRSRWLLAAAAMDPSRTATR